MQFLREAYDRRGGPQRHADACEISWSEAALTHGHSLTQLYTHTDTQHAEETGD